MLLSALALLPAVGTMHLHPQCSSRGGGASTRNGTNVSAQCHHIFSLPDSFRGLEHSLFTAEEDVLHTENKLVDHDLDRCILIG